MIDDTEHQSMFQMGYNFVETYKKYLIINHQLQHKFSYESASNLLYCLLIGTASLNQQEKLLSLVR